MHLSVSVSGVAFLVAAQSSVQGLADSRTASLCLAPPTAIPMCGKASDDCKTGPCSDTRQRPFAERIEARRSGHDASAGSMSSRRSISSRKEQAADSAARIVVLVRTKDSPLCQGLTGMLIWEASPPFPAEIVYLACPLEGSNHGSFETSAGVLGDYTTLFPRIFFFNWCVVLSSYDAFFGGSQRSPSHTHLNPPSTCQKVIKGTFVIKLRLGVRCEAGAGP